MLCILFVEEYGDWNEFSFIDSRRLIKLKKGDRIKIVESYFNSDVFKVILLDGFYKNKTYYVITDDLHRKYKKLRQANEEKYFNCIYRSLYH